MTVIMSAFPGTGKTYLFNNPPEGITMLDSDSSQFSWSAPGERNPDFPGNYIKHIKEHLGKVDLIMVSTHQEVRDALVKAGLPFALVMPSLACKDEYLDRFRRRGSPENFVRLLGSHWYEWIQELLNQRDCYHIGLGPNVYLHDLLTEDEPARDFLDHLQALLEAPTEG